MKKKVVKGNPFYLYTYCPSCEEKHIPVMSILEGGESIILLCGHAAAASGVEIWEEDTWVGSALNIIKRDIYIKSNPKRREIRRKFQPYWEFDRRGNIHIWIDDVEDESNIFIQIDYEKASFLYSLGLTDTEDPVKVDWDSISDGGDVPDWLAGEYRAAGYGRE